MRLIGQRLSIQVVSIQEIKCPDEMVSLMWAKPYISRDVMYIAINTVVGKAKTFNSKLRVLAPQLTGTLACNSHETVFVTAVEH